MLVLGILWVAGIASAQSSAIVPGRHDGEAVLASEAHPEAPTHGSMSFDVSAAPHGQVRIALLRTSEQRGIAQCPFTVDAASEGVVVFVASCSMAGRHVRIIGGTVSFRPRHLSLTFTMNEGNGPMSVHIEADRTGPRARRTP